MATGLIFAIFPIFDSKNFSGPNVFNVSSISFSDNFPYSSQSKSEGKIRPNISKNLSFCGCFSKVPQSWSSPCATLTPAALKESRPQKKKTI